MVPEPRPTTSAQSHGATESAFASCSLDAVELLAADHRRIERLFDEYERCRTRREKADVAERACFAIAMHVLLEGEVFLPEFVTATGAVDVHHLVDNGHQACADLLAQMEDADAADPGFENRMHVLRDVVCKHFREEEKSGGLFALARSAGMELQVLGKRLKTRRNLIERDCLSSRSWSRGKRGVWDGSYRQALR